MSERGRLVVRAIGYGEYVNAWGTIPLARRPGFYRQGSRVGKIAGAWVPIAAADPLSLQRAVRELMRVWDSDESEDWKPGVLSAAVDAVLAAGGWDS